MVEAMIGETVLGGSLHVKEETVTSCWDCRRRYFFQSGGWGNEDAIIGNI